MLVSHEHAQMCLFFFYLQGELELQQLCVAGSSVAVEFGIIGVSLDSLTVMFHGDWVVSCEREEGVIFDKVHRLRMK